MSKIAPPRTYRVKSFGCQMNVYDGERMGPLGIADEFGLDVVLAGLQRMEAEPWGGLRFRPANLLVAKVEAGELGKASGRGFHEYAEEMLDFLS